MTSRDMQLQRHTEGWTNPRPNEVSIVHMIQAWAWYAEDHKRRLGFPIGNDGALGPQWADIGNAIIGLLNGDIGRLDGGTLDHMVREVMHDNGCEAK